MDMIPSKSSFVICVIKASAVNTEIFVLWADQVNRIHLFACVFYMQASQRKT